jgi:hypothetical protein
MGKQYNAKEKRQRAKRRLKRVKQLKAKNMKKI